MTNERKKEALKLRVATALGEWDTVLASGEINVLSLERFDAQLLRALGEDEV